MFTTYLLSGTVNLLSLLKRDMNEQDKHLRPIILEFSSVPKHK